MEILFSVFSRILSKFKYFTVSLFTLTSFIMHCFLFSSHLFYFDLIEYFLIFSEYLPTYRAFCGNISFFSGSAENVYTRQAKNRHSFLIFWARHICIFSVFSPLYTRLFSCCERFEIFISAGCTFLLLCFTSRFLCPVRPAKNILCFPLPTYAPFPSAGEVQWKKAWKIPRSEV